MHMPEPSAIRRFLSNYPTVRRISAVAIFAGASSLALSAQQPTVQEGQPSTPQLVAAVAPLKLSLATVAGVDYSSSSSDLNNPVDPYSADRLNLPVSTDEAMQPPPRRRYGRPRYNDSSHNPDGSNKYTFVLGAGFTGPLGNTFHYLNTQYGIQFGGGRNFNKNFGVLMQFDYDRFGFNGRTLYNEQSLYNYGQSSSSAGYVPALDGNSHIWSFTLDPIYNLSMQGPVGAYFVGAAGFFHKVANFTTPETGEAYSPYYGYYEYTANEVIDHYSSNAPGFNAGVGLTYKPSRFSGERLFAEARYNLTLNSQRHGLTVANINTTAGQLYYDSGATDYYPANSNRTTWLAYKFGIRF